MLKLGAVLLLSLILSPLSYAAYKDFSGTYTCKGYDPYQQKNYTGTVTISKNKKVYDLDMNYGTGEKSKGTGLVRHDELVVVFKDAASNDSPGLEYYNLSEKNHKLTGEWTYLGHSQFGTESCSRIAIDDGANSEVHVKTVKETKITKEVTTN